MGNERKKEAYYVVYLEDWDLGHVFEPNDISCWHNRKPGGRCRVLLVLAATFPHHRKEAELIGNVVVFDLSIEVRGECVFVIAHMRQLKLQ